MASIEDMIKGLTGELDTQSADQKKKAAEYLSELEKIGYTPEMMGRTARESIDPETRNAQMSALRSLQDVYAKGGMDEGSKLALLEAKNRADQQNRSAQEAVRANAAQRGIGGSGLEMANAMLGGQASATNRSMAGTQIASDARTRALQSLKDSANLGASVRGQDMSVAQAQDAINRFNAGQKTDASRYSADTASRVGAQRYASMTGEATDLAKRAEAGREAVGSAVTGVASMAGGPTGIVSGVANLMKPKKLEQQMDRYGNPIY